MNNTFKPIKGYPGYAINESGEVIAFKGKHPRTVGVQKLNCGYLAVKLNDRMVTVHSLVAQTFLGDRPKGMVIDHIDGNRLNNHYTNLRYCTQWENIHNPNTWGKNRGWHHTDEFKRKMSERWKNKGRLTVAIKDGVETTFPTAKEAAEKLGLCVDSIRKCAKGYRHYKTVGGYSFRYEEAH